MNAQTVGATLAAVAKWTGLSLLWVVQYVLYIPFVGFPLWLLRVGGKVVIILLACSIIGWPILLIWLVFFRNQPAKERRSMWTPWGLTKKSKTN